jgi:hypothetical protein
MNISPYSLLSIFSPLLSVIVGWNKKHSLIWIYAVCAIFFDVFTSIYLKKVVKVNSQWSANLFVLLEFVLISFYYKERIFWNRGLFYTILVSFSVFFVVSTTYFSPFVFNLFGASFFCLAYIIYTISAFYFMLQKKEILFLHRSSFFWVNVAFLIYASGTFLLFLSKDYLMTTDARFFMRLWSIVFVTLNIIKHILLALGLSKKTP